MVRLVLGPYTQVWRTICTSVPLRVSIRVPLIARLHRALRNFRTFESTLWANRRVRLWIYIRLTELSGRSVNLWYSIVECFYKITQYFQRYQDVRKNHVGQSLSFCVSINSASRNSRASKNRCGQIVEYFASFHIIFSNCIKFEKNDVCISSSDFVKLYRSFRNFGTYKKLSKFRQIFKTKLYRVESVFSISFIYCDI